MTQEMLIMAAILEIEFLSGGMEYEYEIDAVSGEIIAYDKDTAH